MALGDAASELHAILHKLKEVSANKSTAHVIASVYSCQTSEPEFHEVLSFIRRRIDLVCRQIEASALIPDSGRKERAIGTLKEISGFIHFDQLPQNWETAKARYLSEGNMNRLEGLSNALYHEFPLRRMTQDDADLLKKRIRSLVREVHNELDPVLKDILEGILRSAEWAIQNDEIADHEELTRRALASYGGLIAGDKRARTTAQKGRVRKAAEIVATLMTLYVEAPKLLEITQDYYLPVLTVVVDEIQDRFGAYPLQLPSGHEDKGLPRPRPLLTYGATSEEAQTERSSRPSGEAVDLVEEAGNQSFPASDPPVWTGTWIGGPGR